MKIQIRFKGYQETEEMSEYAERRIGFSLGRFASQIDSVNLLLQDENGPRGGVDQKCQILITLKPNLRLRVENLEDNWQESIDVAADRAGRLVARQIESRRAQRFQSGMVPRERGV